MSESIQSQYKIKGSWKMREIDSIFIFSEEFFSVLNEADEDDNG
jgi:hypothetical protein